LRQHDKSARNGGGATFDPCSIDRERAGPRASVSTPCGYFCTTWPQRQVKDFNSASDTYLGIAEKHHIKTIVVFDCWNKLPSGCSLPEPASTTQMDAGPTT
jgi:hypothetical protein